MSETKEMTGFLIVGVLIGVAMMMVIFAITESNIRTDLGYICQINGYSDIVTIRDNPYCYRLDNETGELILVDSLKEEKSNE